MVKLCVPLLILLAAGLALAQKPMSVVGTWVADKRGNEEVRFASKVTLVLKKDGKFSFTGLNTKGEGVYKVNGQKLTLSVSMRNGGKPTNPHESGAAANIAEGGKAILMPTGMERNGKPLMLRLIRKM